VLENIGMRSENLSQSHEVIQRSVTSELVGIFDGSSLPLIGLKTN